MAKLVCRSVWKVTYGDWVLNSPRFYDVGQVQYAFYSGLVQ